MLYDAHLTWKNPGCVVIVVDQSAITAQLFGNQPSKTKAEAIADAVNSLLYDLVIRCARGDGIHECLRVGVIGYGATVGSALGGVLAGGPLLTIGEVANNPLRVELRERFPDRKMKIPIWVEPKAKGNAPSSEPLGLTRIELLEFLQRHPDCFPPLVLHYTSRMPDEVAELIADSLRGLASSNGGVLLWNCYLMSKQHPPISFPAVETELPDEPARKLFQMSSYLPSAYATAIQSDGYSVTPRARAFVLNGNLFPLVGCLPTGSEPLVRELR